MTEDGSQADPDPVLGRIRRMVADYPAGARARVESLALAVARLRATGGTDVASLSDAMSHAHKLAGSAGSLGFPALGQMAAVLEVLLRARLEAFGSADLCVVGRDRPGAAGRPDKTAAGETADPSGTDVRDEGDTTGDSAPGTPVVDQARLLVERLRAQAAGLSTDVSTLMVALSAEAESGALRARARGRHALLVGAEDSHAWPDLTTRLRAYGWSAREVRDGTDLEALAAMPDGPDPATILVDLDARPQASAVLARLADDAGPWAEVPWFLVAGSPSAKVRGEAAKRGAAGVLAAPVSAESVLDRHAAVRAARREDMPRALILDPDPALAIMARHILDEAGLLTEVATDPDALWAAADGPSGASGVDVVVLAERPGAGGPPETPDLARALRQDPVFDGTRLVLVLPTAPPDGLTGAWAPWVDVLLVGPLDPIPFVTTVLAQARRAQDLRSRRPLEGAGPLLTVPALADLLADLMVRARRLGMPLTVAWMATDADQGEAAARDEAVIRLLREALRPSDHVGRGPGRGLSVVLPFTPLDEARALAEPLAARLETLVPGARLATGWATLEDADRAAEGAASVEALLARACAAADAPGA
ncbi:Hpt domain-containing protein [Roseospira visakhapatnamensis]|uniref:HPt (Histidine-containing phosphotransfer) domain-containing protein/CheY-like chemotaxis protein n=1 Tax=Roseospira visakhapatnamensis TaxID=390880 RepID=A0A7W6WBA5_9PROT|nr:Hpt domain-containing protein [Roseospira visakhapatnamensis]MBB4267332.1 HPt (histidine-containing phosphotransfer) domain-containing protein/CheY-like chemotaxis protein [Roseospira visakhapatnamensis]